jgi:D-glycero-D-manno-heptose 1,7-bisphosphate phosphatase
VNKRAVFLDRDGTLVRDAGFTHRVNDLDLLDHVVAGLARMAAMGFRLIIATNQSGIARGYFTESQMQAFHAALVDRLRTEGVEIAAVYFCPFHPTEGLGPYRRDSPLRKPSDGMLRQAAAEHGLDLGASFAVGDKKSDVLAGKKAGCRTILVRTGAGGLGEPELTAQPDFVAAHLLEAAHYIRNVADN